MLTTLCCVSLNVVVRYVKIGYSNSVYGNRVNVNNLLTVLIIKVEYEKKNKKDEEEG